MKSEPEPPWASDEQVRRGRAAEFGTAVHALLERVDLRDYADLGERAHRIAREFGMSERAGEIERVARNALESAVLDRARASKRVLREVAFTAPLPRRRTGFAEGRIDLLFIEDGADGPGIVVVDFKTDNVRARRSGGAHRELSSAGAGLRMGRGRRHGASSPRGGVPVRAAAAGVGDRVDAAFMAEADAR